MSSTRPLQRTNPKSEWKKTRSERWKLSLKKACLDRARIKRQSVVRASRLKGSTTARDLITEEIQRSVVVVAAAPDHYPNDGGAAEEEENKEPLGWLSEEEMMELMRVVEDELQREEEFVEEAMEDMYTHQIQEEKCMEDQIVTYETWHEQQQQQQQQPGHFFSRP